MRFGVHFSGRGLAISTACFHVVKEPPKMVLRRMIGPSLETGAVFDSPLFKDSRRIAIWCLCCRYKKNVMKNAGVGVRTSWLAHGDGSKFLTTTLHLQTLTADAGMLAARRAEFVKRAELQFSA